MYNNKEYCKGYRKKNRKSILIKIKAKQKENLESWLGLIPSETKCECCGADIIFNSGNNETSIHFDHRTGTEEIGGSPTHWLQCHKRTKKNEEIFRLCNFGMLCNQCNRFIPVRNRLEFLRMAAAYASKT